MRFVVVSNLFPPAVLGGYELLAKDVVDGLRRRGHEVLVLTTSANASASQDEVRTLVLSRPFGEAPGRDRLRHLYAGWLNANATRQALREFGPVDAALLMSQRRLGLAPWHVLQDEGIPVVVTVNDDWPVAFCPAQGDEFGLKVRRVCDELPHGRSFRGLKAEHVVYLSDAVRETVLKAGAPLPMGEVLAQGVDSQVFRPRPLRPMSSAPRLLFVGRLHPSKAPELAIDAVASLRARGVLATLDLAGQAYEDAYLESLRRRANDLGVGDAVRFLGLVERSQLPALFAEADALIFASRLAHEGQGLTYLEAMACGVPVVASPSGGAMEFLGKHYPECIVKAPTAEAVADDLQRLIHDECHHRRTIARGHELVSRHASLEVYLDRLLAKMTNAAQRAA